MLALIAGTIIILQTASYYLVAIICVVLLLNREHYSFSLSFHGVGRRPRLWGGAGDGGRKG